MIRYVTASEIKGQPLCPRSFFYKSFGAGCGKATKMLEAVRLHEEIERVLRSTRSG